MPYKRRTSFFGIPVPGSGDRINSETEMDKANLIENQLIAASRGAYCCVYEDGEYTALKGSDGFYVVRCSSYGGKPALLGVINRGLAQTFSTVKWANLNEGFFYYLYAEWTNTQFTNEESFAVTSYTSKQAQLETNLLLATLDLTGEVPVIDSNPDGKLYAKDFTSHINDTTNPHSPVLTQDELVVRKQLRAVVSDVNVKGGAIQIDDTRGGSEPSIETKGEMVLKDVRMSVALSDINNPELKTEETSLVGAINELCDRNKIKAVSAVFAGVTGITVEVVGALEIDSVFVMAEKGGIPDSGVGDVCVGYFQQDVDVPRADTFRVYNTGGIGGRFRATVLYR